MKEKCVFCGTDIDPKNYAVFKARGKEKFACLPCYDENKEAIGYMTAIENLTTRCGKVVTLASSVGAELVSLNMKKEEKEV